MQDNTNAVALTGGASLQPQNAAAAISMSREAAEVITQMQIAKAFPRNTILALAKIKMACSRTRLAEAAIYTYTRGGTEVTGPSIRLAEAIAQNWGNMAFCVREIKQKNNGSVCEAFAVDYETNTRVTKTFFVSHIRHTKKGDYLVTDPRDIYEMVANNGARRVRACILAVVPGDIVEEAIEECKKTIEASVGEAITPEGKKKLCQAFAAFGVSQAMLEKFIQRHLDSITASQVVRLRGIYQSIKDGMSKPKDWFGEEEKPEDKGAKKESAEETFKKASQSAFKAMGKGKTPKKASPPLKTPENAPSGDSTSVDAEPETEATPETAENGAESELLTDEEAEEAEREHDVFDEGNDPLPW